MKEGDTLYVKTKRGESREIHVAKCVPFKNNYIVCCEEIHFETSPGDRGWFIFNRNIGFIYTIPEGGRIIDQFFKTFDDLKVGDRIYIGPEIKRIVSIDKLGKSKFLRLHDGIKSVQIQDKYKDNFFKLNPKFLIPDPKIYMMCY